MLSLCFSNKFIFLIMCIMSCSVQAIIYFAMSITDLKETIIETNNVFEDFFNR